MDSPVVRCPQCHITVFRSSNSWNNYCSAHQPPEGVDPDAVLLDVTTGQGKYRFIYHMDAKRPQGFRHGVPHGPTQDHLTSNAVRSLVERVSELEEERAVLFFNCSINPLTDEGRAIYEGLEKDYKNG